jgi:F-type H+-transporting ATPase subunit epsilon
MEPLMNLKILLPHQVFVEKKGVKRIVAESAIGSFGILPQRLDCTAALVPGILLYETEDDGEVYVAIDEGVLVKAGSEVNISIRNAIAGSELGALHKAVEQDFLKTDEQEKKVRSVIAKLETGFIRKLQEFRQR